MLIFLPSGGSNNNWDDELFRKFVLSVGIGFLPFLIEEMFFGGSLLGRVITIPIIVMGYIIGLWISVWRKR